MALVLRSARLLPPNHPFLNPMNIGRYGLVAVLSVAANNLILSRNNTDQLMIFVAVALAILMTVVQVFVIAVCVVFTPDSALASTTGGMFSSPNPDSDVALTFLQQAIGLDGFFNNSRPIGLSISNAIFQMLGFYSTALLLIATCIVVYYVITLVGEAAQTGSPFGRRFNGLWAPVRLVLALGLLVPLGNGLNAAQYTVLTIAKLGSGFATQAWNRFSDALLDESLTKPPVAPIGFTETAKAIFLYEVCAESYNIQNKSGPKVAISNVVPKGVSPSLAGAGPTEVSSQAQVNFIAINWQAKAPHSVNPRNQIFSCGSLKIDYSLAREGPTGKAIAESIISAYANAVDYVAANVRETARKYAAAVTPSPGNTSYIATATLPDAEQITQVITTAERQILAAVDSAHRAHSHDFNGSAFNTADSEMKAGGWGTAANFYMRLARAYQFSLEVTRATTPKPTATDTASEAKSVSNSEWRASWGSWDSWMNWLSGSEEGYSKLGKQAEHIKAAIDKASQQITAAIPDTPEPIRDGYMAKMVNNSGVLTNAIWFLFGVSQLWELADPATQDVHPILKLTQLGSDILWRCFWFFSAGGVLSLFNFTAGIGSIILLVAFVGIGIGFVLAYVLPLMPFIYFFFAIVEWVMGIFEGLIGAPLWALAHLRIDGDGMPGQAAMNGYFILFGILIRPILILFSLLASYVIFSAGAYFLNLIFGDVIIGDITKSGSTVGAFGYVGYLIMYAVIVYNLGLTCFKMIDQVPAQVMRWIGQSNLHYQDGKPDPIGSTSQVAMAAGTFLGPQLANSVAGALGPKPGKDGLGTVGLNKMRGMFGGSGQASASASPAPTNNKKGA
jgi:conjugal transfer/type IV secretion protein DotA/TraY